MAVHPFWGFTALTGAAGVLVARFSPMISPLPSGYVRHAGEELRLKVFS
jgi:hypothetical protein